MTGAAVAINAGRPIWGVPAGTPRHSHPRREICVLLQQPVRSPPRSPAAGTATRGHCRTASRPRSGFCTADGLPLDQLAGVDVEQEVLLQRGLRGQRLAALLVGQDPPNRKGRCAVLWYLAARGRSRGCTLSMAFSVIGLGKGAACIRGAQAWNERSPSGQRGEPDGLLFPSLRLIGAQPKTYAASRVSSPRPAGAGFNFRILRPETKKGRDLLAAFAFRQTLRI